MFDALSAEADRSEFVELRAQRPLSRLASGAWYLARHDDVLAATKDVHSFLASFREPGVIVPDEEQLANEIPEPRHGQIRRIINSAIASQHIAGIEPYVRELCDQLLGETLDEGGVVDLVERYVMPVPNNVIAHLMGAPPSDYLLWARWSEEVVEGTYPTKNRNERGVGLAGAHPEFSEYVDRLIADRTASPRDDFITRLVHTEIDGRRLTAIEARSQLVFLFISGNETTRHLIGNLLWTVANDAALFERLRSDRTLIPAAIEESLRHDPPVRFLMRTCTAEVSLHGEQIYPHEKVAFGLASANRDESRYDAPHEFRLDRPDQRGHLAFGGGPHVCPGAGLARLEARVALDVFLDRVASVRALDKGRYENVPVAWARGPRALMVELTPA